MRNPPRRRYAAIPTLLAALLLATDLSSASATRTAAR